MATSASIRRRPRQDGTVAYDVRYRHEGHQRSLRFLDEKSADAFVRVYRSHGHDFAIESLQIENTRDRVPSVDEYAERYIDSLSGVEGKTLDHYRAFMRIWISPVMGPLPLTSVTPETITGWVNGMARAGSAEKSIKNRHGFLFAMFSQAIDRSILDRNPCKGTRISATETEDMMALTRPQFAKLYEHIPKRSRPLVAFLLMTGVRFSEATALKRTDFDLDEETVTIRRAWKYSSEKSWYMGPPKTKMSRRTISLPPEWRAEIRPLVEKSRSEFVFTNGAGRPVRQSTFHKAIWDPARRRAWDLKTQAECKRVGEDPTAPFQLPRVHDLRHTHATWLVSPASSLARASAQSHASCPTMSEFRASARNAMLAGALPALATI